VKTTEPKKEEKKVQESFIPKVDLKEKQKTVGEEISIASNVKPKEKKPEPVKKVDKTELELNKMIGSKLGNEKEERERPAAKEYPQKGYKGQGKYEKKEQARFAFDKDAFPELK